jgi:excisionase family DNA binding protein
MQTRLIKPLLSTEEVATILRVSRRTVRLWSARGLLTPVRIGRQLRFRQSDVVTLIRWRQSTGSIKAPHGQKRHQAVLREVTRRNTGQEHQSATSSIWSLKGFSQSGGRVVTHAHGGAA